MKKITENEYLEALGIVRKYLAQIKTEINKANESISIFDRNIDTFDLSVRSLNGLRHSCMVETVRDLVNLTEFNFKKSRLIGKKTISEVTDFMTLNQLYFGMLKKNNESTFEGMITMMKSQTCSCGHVLTQSTCANCGRKHNQLVDYKNK